MFVTKVGITITSLITAAMMLSVFPASAAGQPFITITAPSAYLYSGPSRSNSKVYSVFQGQQYFILARNADNSWLRLNYPGATSEAWVQVIMGAVSGDISALPVSEGSASAPAPATAPADTPTASAATTTAAGSTLPGTKFKFTITAPSSYVRSGPEW